MVKVNLIKKHTADGQYDVKGKRASLWPGLILERMPDGG